MTRRNAESVARDYLDAAGLWDTGLTVITRQAASGRLWSASEVTQVIAAHRAAFIDFALEHLRGQDAETLRDRESDLDIESVRRLRGVSVATIRRRRKRLEPKLERLWRAWGYSTWRRGPDDVPLLYRRARRHDPDQ